MLEILFASDWICLTLSEGKLISRVLVFTIIPRNSRFWDGVITDFSVLTMNPRQVNK